MTRILGRLNVVEGNRLAFWCPGCDDVHQVKHGEPAGWGWNGDHASPTFTPSVLVTSGHYVDGQPEGGSCWCKWNAEHPGDPSPYKCYRCHSYVTDGRIQFLGDCTHQLAGQTVELPDYPRREEAT